MSRRRPSRNWPAGSTRQWRRIRLQVLARDGWVCRLCNLPIDPSLRPPHPGSASVHHVTDRALVGDDPRALLSTHRACNAAAGDPAKTNPQPRTLTDWGLGG